MNDTDLRILDNLYKKTLKMGRILYNEAAEKVTVETASKLESYAELLLEMNDKLEDILNLSDRYARECLSKATEIRKLIDIRENIGGNAPDNKNSSYVKLYDGLTWGEIQEHEDIRDEILSDVDHKISQNNDKNKNIKKPAQKASQLQKDTPLPAQITYKTMSSIYAKPLGFDWKVPIISKLSELPSSIYWYNGDMNNPAGLYTCITRGFYTQIPFPNVIDATQNFNRTGSIKCKYNNITDCLEFRKNLAARYNSDIRECNFAHEGDQYIKLGTTFRCPHKPRFGNHTYLNEDMNNVLDSDIKTMLMYSLSDVLLSSLWFQKTKTGDEKSNMILSNIDIC